MARLWLLCLLLLFIQDGNKTLVGVFKSKLLQIFIVLWNIKFTSEISIKAKTIEKLKNQLTKHELFPIFFVNPPEGKGWFMCRPENLSFARNSDQFLIFTSARNSNFFRDNLHDLSSYFFFTPLNCASSKRNSSMVLFHSKIILLYSVDTTLCTIYSYKNLYTILFKKTPLLILLFEWNGNVVIKYVVDQ